MPNKSNIKVLYLPRWYPNRYDPMPGLFIQRHAEAANLYCEIGVVYVHTLEYQKNIAKYDIESSVINNVPTVKVYYRNPKINLPIITPMIKVFRYYKANFMGIKCIKSTLGSFDILHIHILTRLGILGLFYKWLFGKKFFISEHWSRYLDLTGNFKGSFRKFATQIIVKNSETITTVTENLSKAMQRHSLVNKNYIVLPNVISPDFLNAELIKTDNQNKKTIVHVSCFEDKSKNISGILNVIKKLAEYRSDFNFIMIGDGMDFDKLKVYSDKLGLTEKYIQFTGLMEGDELVKKMQLADALLIFSNYENFPVVINEAFSLGIPVVATRVGGIPENVTTDNGLLVDPGDEDGLFEKINDFMDNKYLFDKQKIKQKALHDFSMETVGKQLFDIYLDKQN